MSVRRAAVLWILVLWGLAVPALALTTEEARHLVARTGFGATPTELEALAGSSRAEAVAYLLDGVGTTAATPPPDWVDEPLHTPAELRDLSEEERNALKRERRRRERELKGWWVQEMMTTDSPLTERLTLFWHNHFTSAFEKVKSPQLMYRQNATLRRFALGNYRDFLHAMIRDPALLVYLDNHRSRVDNLNENLGRELLELFTLGEGNYTEDDVKAAARALTGYSVDRETGLFRFRPRWHDDGEKTFLGRTGPWDADDIVEIILEQPEAATRIVEKLWRAFVSPTPDPAEVERIAQRFRGADYALRPLMEALLLSDAFWNPEQRGGLVKSPADLVVGTLRLLEIPARRTALVAAAMAQMGQNLMDPPNVKGWPGGNAWINSGTLLVRQDFFDLLAGEGIRRASRRMAATARAARRRQARLRQALDEHIRQTVAQVGREDLQALMLPLAPLTVLPDTGDDVAWFHAVLSDPVYQVQ